MSNSETGRKKIAGNRPPASEPSAAAVEAFLAAHPDFLARRPAIAARLLAPSRFEGDAVVDFQQALVDMLRRRLAESEGREQELIATSRANLSVQARVHEGVLSLLAARTFEHLIETVTTDLAIQLDLDAVGLCVESERDKLPHTLGSGIHVMVPGTIDRLLGPGRNVLLVRHLDGDSNLFGAAAHLVESAAFLRLNVSPATPPGLLCLGSRLEGKFHTGQGTELLTFLARALEHTIRSWLDLPPE